MGSVDIETIGHSRWRARFVIALLVLATAGVAGLLVYGAWFGGGRERAATATVDIQTIGRSRWRTRIAIILLALVAIGAGGFLAYGAWFGGDGSQASAFNTQRIAMATIRTTVTMSAVAESTDNAALSFGVTGRVESVDVALGDEVKAGQRLASLEVDDLENALASAEANLASARIRLQQVLNGASAADVANADKAVAAAQAALNKALNDQQDLLDGASEANLAVADQAVKSAQSALATAQDNLRRLEEGPSEAEIARAQSGVDTASAGLTSAQAAEQTAFAGVDAAKASLQGAATVYCNTDEHILVICDDFVIPLNDSDIRTLSSSVAPDADPQAEPALVAATTALINANAGYESAIDALDQAKAGVNPAESTLTAAQEALDDLKSPPDPSEMAAAQAAVTAAEQALTAAQLAQDDLVQGATDSDMANAQGAVDSAQATLNAAIAARYDLLAGADAEDIDLQRQQVKLAELAVERARKAVDDATLTAPFGGTAAAVAIHVGDVVSPSVPAITILTPNALRVKLTLGETDLPAIKVGQPGLIIFDAIQDTAYPIKVTSIGLAPETSQGVVTYTALADLTRQNDSGQAFQLAPGMNGAAVITTAEKANVLVVPNQAVRRRGNDQVVDVLVDGKPETRVIRTGSSDATNSEVTSGLQAGDLVILPGAARAAGETPTPESEEDIPGGIR